MPQRPPHRGARLQRQRDKIDLIIVVDAHARRLDTHHVERTGLLP